MQPSARGTWTRISGNGLAKAMAAACLLLVMGGTASVVHANLRDVADPAEPGLYARLSLELESRLATRQPGEQALVTLGPNGRDVRLWGELGEGTAERLEALLKANRHVERIHLTSEGGLVDEGEAIGELVAEHGLVTYVPDYCVSACTLAFIRGRERYVVANARLGFHAPYEQGLFGQDFQADAAPERAAYLAAGIEPGFVDAALKVRSDDLWIPQAARLLEARVATGIVDLHRFPDSTLDDGAEPAGARAALLRNFPLIRALAPRQPEIVDGLAAWYLDAYRAGLSEADAVSALKTLSVRKLGQAAREGDDATVVALGRQILKAVPPAAEARSCGLGEADRDAPSEVTTASRFERAALHASDPVRIDARQGAQRDLGCAALLQRVRQALALPGRAKASEALRTVLASVGVRERVREVSAAP